MRRKSNKIQFFALAFVMLFSVVNAWGLGLKTNILRLRQQGGNTTWNADTKKMTWSANYSNLWYIEPLTPYYDEGNGNDPYKGKDLFGYSKLILKLSGLKNTNNANDVADIRIVIESVKDGIKTEYYYPVSKNGTTEIPFHSDGWKNMNSPNAHVSVYDMLKNTRSVRIGGRCWSGEVVIEEMYLCKDLECDANGNVTIGWEDLVANSDNLQRYGDFVKIDSRQKGWAGLGFSFDKSVAVESISVKGSLDNGYVDGERGFINNFALNFDDGTTEYPGKAWNTQYSPKNPEKKMTGFEVVFSDTGYGTGHVESVSLKLKALGTVYLKDVESNKYLQTIYYYGTPITMPEIVKVDGRVTKKAFAYGDKSPKYTGEKYSPSGSIVLGIKWLKTTIGQSNQSTPANGDFSDWIKIPANTMREFSFTSNGHGSKETNWGMWVMKNSNGYDANTVSSDAYFFMDISGIQTFVSGNSSQVGSVVYTCDNGTFRELTATEWNVFLRDLNFGCDVHVKMYNHDGKLRVYSYMVSKDLAKRTYVYPYEYKESIPADVFVGFTVNKTYISNFDAFAAVPLTKLGFDVSGIDETDNKMTNSDIANSSVEIRTMEGMPIAIGTMAGQGETYKYKAIPSSGWEFAYWSYVGGSTANPRDVTITETNIKEHNCSPVAKFKMSTTTGGFQIAKDRVYYLDFENVVNADVAPMQGQVALVNESPADGQVQEYQKGHLYNYGNRGRIYNDPIFGNYYQNLAIDVNEFTESKSQNFLRIVLTDAQKDELMPIAKSGEATIGFWVNGRIANRYELPLERGSMFCAFSNDCFAIADNQYIKPRYMFDIACNGWTYSYMPNNDREDYADNPRAMNKFFYGEDVNVVADNVTPKASLFGKYYTHSQDQRQHKFYDDNEWHYVTYVASDGLKKIKVYLDGVQTGTLDVEKEIKNTNL